MRLLVLASLFLLLVPSFVFASPIEFKIDEVYRTSGGGPMAYVDYQPQKNKTYSFIDFVANLWHHENCGSEHILPVVVYRGNITVDSGVWDGPNTCGNFDGSIILNNKTGDRIVGSSYFGSRSAGFWWIEFHMPQVMNKDLTRDDGAKSFGEVGLLTDASPVSNMFRVSSNDEDIIVWVGDETIKNIAETTDSTAEVYACFDTNFNDICDGLEDDTCVNNNGDWYRGKCCSAAGGSDAGCSLQNISLVVNGQPRSYDAWCGINEQNQYEWAAEDDEGVAHKLSVCPEISMLGTGTELLRCGSTPIGGTVAFPSQPTNIRSGSQTHSYFCNISSDPLIGTLIECAGSGVKWAGPGGISYITGSKYLTKPTYYCTEDGSFTTDLDPKSSLSCTQAGFTYVGGRCCSEADDVGETYEAIGDIGACWNGSYIANGYFSSNKQVFATGGTLQGCTVSDLLPDITQSFPATACINDAFLNDMVRWWTGDGNAVDLEADQSAELISGVKYSAGMVKSAFNLTAPGAYLIAEDASALNIVGDLTLDAWIRFPSAQLRENRTIVSKGALNGLTYEFLFTPTGPALDVIRLGFKIRTPTESIVTSEQLSLDTEWHHVAVTKSGSTVEFYFDGKSVSDAELLSQSAVASAGEPLLIGASKSGVDAFGNPTVANLFGGFIDELEIFDVALDRQDVEDIYQADNSGKCKPLVLEPTLPHFNGMCTIISQGTSSGDAFCGANSRWGVDSKGSGKSILKSIDWIPVAGEIVSSCCNQSSCWMGKEDYDVPGTTGPKIVGGCQNDQLQINDPSTNYYGRRCEGGLWVNRTKRFKWDYSAEGYCSTETQCYVTPSGKKIDNDDPGKYFTSTPPQCIENGQYFTDYLGVKGEHYCENGIWSTRTKQIALYLLNYSSKVSPTQYRLLCGPAQETLNDWQTVSSLIGGSSCSNGTDTAAKGIPCLNNFCVLETPNGVAWGVSLNNPVNAIDDNFISNHQGLKLAPDACDNTLSSSGYAKCSGNDNLWYSPELNSLIFIPADTLEPFSFADFFAIALKNPLDALKLFVFGQLHNPVGVGNDFSFFNKTQTFSKVYAARSNDQKVFAFYETSIMPKPGIPAVDFIGIRYENIALGDDPCNNLLQTGAQGAIRSGVACTSSANEVQIITDIHQLTTTNPINAVWKDLTGKLRPGE